MHAVVLPPVCVDDSDIPEESARRRRLRDRGGRLILEIEPGVVGGGTTMAKATGGKRGNAAAGDRLHN
jgi:hypothetical protein